MVLNSSHVFIVNRLQELKTLRLDKAEVLFNRSTSSIYRYIQDINLFLPPQKKILISDLNIISTLQYDDYIKFVQGLTLQSYIPSQLERFQYMLVTCFLEGIVNLSNIYNQFGLSQSTKKKDRKAFEAYLKNIDLSLQSFPGKGVTIIGNEFSYRVSVSQIVFRLIEVNSKWEVYQRKANNPIQRKIFLKYFDLILTKQSETIDFFLEFLKGNNLLINYPSKKYSIVYFCLANYRIHNNNVTNVPLHSPLSIKDFQFTDHKTENSYYNIMICSQDYSESEPICEDTQLIGIVNRLIQDVESNIISTFYTKDLLFSEVYSFLYKCTLRNLCQFDFFDDKLTHTKEIFTNLFNILKMHIKKFELTYSPLKEDQLATLTLIFRQHILKNKVSGRNKKRIIIATNSAKEKTNFFIELLMHAVDIEVVQIIHMNELELLKESKFDYLITFSNRISAILSQRKYNILKLNYFISDNDVNYLLDHGFSSNSKRKILATDFIDNIKGISPDQLEQYLVKYYSEYFL